MPYINNARRYISMAQLREDWLTQHKANIKALPLSNAEGVTDGAKSPAQSVGKWEAWRKVFLVVGVDARYIIASTPHSSKKVMSIRAELADYIRRNAPELLSGNEYEKRTIRNRRHPSVNALIREERRFEDS